MQLSRPGALPQGPNLVSAPVLQTSWDAGFVRGRILIEG